MTKNTEGQTQANGATEAAEKPRRDAPGRRGGKQTQKRKKASSSAPAAPGRTGRPKGTKGKSDKPGRVVAIGLDVPRLDDIKAEAAQKAAESAKPDGYEFGRPTAYRLEYARIAKALCARGASDMELAQEFEVSTSTVWLWRCRHEDFSSALQEGKDAWDDRIERSLAQRAAGYSVHVERLFHCEGTVVRAETIEHYPPDVGAIKLWLGNRRPDKWKDKQDLKLDSGDAFLAVLKAISDGTINRSA